MHHLIKMKLPLFLCLIICFTSHTAAQGVEPPVPVLISETYTEHYIYETIDVPDVDFLEVTSSNDHGHYAGNTKNKDGKLIGFTLIDGQLTTYDVPDSLQTTFYGLNNAGQAAGFYIDQDDISHGIILQDGALVEWNFPDALNTQIFGITEDGQVVGDIIDANEVVNGFVGEMHFDVPGATTTFVDHINASGVIVGSYIDAEEKYHGFIKYPDGSIADINVPGLPNPEYIFVNAINDSGVIVFRAKAPNDIARSYVLHPNSQPLELQYPGSVETVLRDIDMDGNVTGYYDMPDGRRHGCVVRPTSKADAERFNNVFHTDLTKGLNMLSIPLESTQPMTARSLAGLAGATFVIALDADNQSFIGWTPNAPNDGFPIEGGQGYIVNVPQPRSVIHVGAHWMNKGPVAAAPNSVLTTIPRETWAFVVSGQLKGTQNFNGYQIAVRNLRTNTVMAAQVQDNYFVSATADLNYQSVVQVGDTLELHVTDTNGNIASEKFSFEVTPTSLANAVLSVNLDGIGKPQGNRLLQNYPNPFNPETWIPYQLSEDSPVSVTIYDSTGKLIRELSFGLQTAGFYHSHGRAAYWDGKNTLGERVASGVYFYRLGTPSFQQTRRMIVLK
ncbi:MAG: T9SS type A sorting domain-containing protein [Candidatus Poribacteria bacterium]|nr:T9SS type A sorting domain-containing protein [Candidatus Poribacteria bacterium]